METAEEKYRKKISLGQDGNALVMVIAISLVLYVSLAMLKAVWYYRFAPEEAPVFFRQNILAWLTLPADGNQFLHRPWTLLTHGFVHDNIWKVFSNMLWLWAFGTILQDLTGNRKIAPLFIYGTIGGAIAFILAYNFLPSLHPLLPVASLAGGSAGVMAVAIATTLISPQYRIFRNIGNGIPLWVITALYAVSDLALVSISDTATLIHHLAGAVTGLLFVYFLKMGYDWTDWMSNFFEWAGNLFNPDKPKRGKDISNELFYKSDGEPFTKKMNLTQQRVDEILDKINRHGYESLSEEEKELLKRASSESF